MKKTLLEIAKTVRPKFTDEEIGLTIAYLNGEIRAVDIGAAINVESNYSTRASSFICSVTRYAISTGKIKIKIT